MQVQTKQFYFGISRRAIKHPGEEILGIAVGRVYFGLYTPGYFPWHQNLAFGILNENGGL